MPLYGIPGFAVRSERDLLRMSTRKRIFALIENRLLMHMPIYTQHPYNEKRISAEQFNSLRQSIVENGYDPFQPILLYQNQIIDGVARYEIYLETGITPTFKDLYNQKHYKQYEKQLHDKGIIIQERNLQCQ